MIIVGIDIGKHNHEATLIDEKGNTIGSSVRFTNSHQGANKLLSHIEKYNSSNEEVIFAMEATGHYWLSLYSRLLNDGYCIHVINPIQTDACRSFYIRETKNDKKDSFLIAQVIRFNNSPKTVLPDEIMISLKELSRFRTYLVDTISDYKRKAITVLDKSFPEYARLFSDTFGKTSKDILSKYPLPKDILNVEIDEIVETIATSSKGRLGYSKAEELKSAAQNTFGINFATDALAFETQVLIDSINFMEIKVKQLDEQIAQILETIDSPITTIPGIGPVLGAIILSEIGDISRFKDASKLVAYAGIDPTVRQSGEFNGTNNKMSKRGSPFLRRAIWSAAMVATFNDPLLNEFYNKKRAEGKHHGTALGAVARKLTYIIFAILRDNKPYIQQ